MYILGVGMTKSGKHSDKGVKDLTGESLQKVLEDSGLPKVDLETAWFSNSGRGQPEFQHCIRDRQH